MKREERPTSGMVCDKEAAAARVTVQPVETHVLCSWSTRGAHLNNPSLALQQTVQIFVWEFTETSGIEFGLALAAGTRARSGQLEH